MYTIDTRQAEIDFRRDRIRGEATTRRTRNPFVRKQTSRPTATRRFAH